MPDLKLKRKGVKPKGPLNQATLTLNDNQMNGFLTLRAALLGSNLLSRFPVELL